jgi:RecB family exonuclease
MSAALTHPPALFKNDHLSVSRLKLYEQCAYAFWCRYVEKTVALPDGTREPRDLEPRGSAADAGVALHAALERAYAWVIAEEYAGPFPEEEMIAGYRAAWEASSTLTGVTLYQEGLEMLRTYAKSHATVDHLTILANEKEFNVQVEEFLINGYIDLIEKTGPDAIRITDFKSNRLLFAKDQLDDDLQAAVYLHVARVLYPWAKTIEFHWAMLRHDTNQTTERPTASVEDGMQYVVTLGRRIERDIEWKQTLNANCSFCDHRRQCKTYARALAGGHEYTKAASLADLASVSVEREALQKIAKAAYARKKNLDEVLKKRLEVEGPFTVNGHAYRAIPAYSMSYPDPSPVIRLLQGAGVPAETVIQRVMVVDKDAVEKLVEETIAQLPRPKGLLLKATVEGVAKLVAGTPRLDSRPVGPKTEKAVAPTGKEQVEKETKRTRAKKDPTE